MEKPHHGLVGENFVQEHFDLETILYMHMKLGSVGFRRRFTSFDMGSSCCGWEELMERGYASVKPFAHYLNIEPYNFCDLLRNQCPWSMEFTSLRGLSNKVTSAHGVKQGCPLFPTLFGLSIKDFMLHRSGGSGASLAGALILWMKNATVTNIVFFRFHSLMTQ